MLLGILGEVVGTLVLLGVVEGVLAGGVSRAPFGLGPGGPGAGGGALVAGLEVEILWLGLLFPLDFGKGVVGKLGTPPLGMGIPPIWLGPGPMGIGPMLPGLIPGLIPCR